MSRTPHVDPLTVACPICGRPVGSTCRTQGEGQARFPHSYRRTVAAAEASVPLRKAPDYVEPAHLSFFGDASDAHIAARVREFGSGGRPVVVTIWPMPSVALVSAE